MTSARFTVYLVLLAGLYYYGWLTEENYFLTALDTEILNYQLHSLLRLIARNFSPSIGFVTSRKNRLDCVQILAKFFKIILQKILIKF